MKNKKKLIIIIAIGVIALALIIAGIVYFLKNRNTSAVDVYSMDLLNNAAMYSDYSELSGTITSDYVQEVYPEEDLDVEEVYVKQGDTVKEGDKLLKYNVEEEELDLQLQELEIKSSKMQIEEMEKELKKLKGTKTAGAMDASGSNLLNASLNMSAFQGNVLASLMGAAEKDTSSIENLPDKTEKTEKDASKAEDSSAAGGAENKEDDILKKEETEDASKKTDAEKKDGAEKTTADNVKDSLKTESKKAKKETNSPKEETTEEEQPAKSGLYKEITSLSQAASGDGTEKKPYVFNIEEAAKIKGSVLDALIGEKSKEMKYAYIFTYASEEKYKADAEKEPDKKENYAAKITIDAKKYADEFEKDKMYSAGDVKKALKDRHLKDDIASVDDRDKTASGDGSANSPYVFLLTDEGKIQGTVIAELLEGDKTAQFKVYESESAYADDKSPQDTFTLEPGYAADTIEKEKGYSLKELKEAAESLHLRTKITEVSQAFEGNGSANFQYYYYLKEGGTVRGSVIRELAGNKEQEGAYASFMEFADEKAYKAKEPGQTVTILPGTPVTGIAEDTDYTLSKLQEALDAAEQAAEVPNVLKSQITDKTKDAFRGTGKKDDSYIYRLISNGRIRGSVINDLLKNNEYAVFYEYDSEEDGRKENAANSITIRPTTLFKETITSFGWYTIDDLNDALVMANKIQIKPARKTVQKGKTYHFTANITGKNKEALTVSWEIKRNKSTATTLANGVLTVGADETADTLRIIASAGGKRDVLTVKVKDAKESSSGGNSGGGGDDFGGGSYGGDGDTYTADELKDAISDKEDEIAEAKQSLNEAKISYQEAKKEVDAATVKANVSGTVTLAYTKEAMPEDGSPAIIVRAEDGMYVNLSVSEMDLDSVKVGGTIFCVSDDTGEEYEAVIKEISEFPVSGNSYYDGMSNPNSSYYPMVAYIKDADGLNTGNTVTVSYSSQSMGTVAEDAIFLQKAYVRTEDDGDGAGKKSYVYKEGKNGRLEKQYVETGTTIYGQYVEIVSGLNQDDNIAFPYGKNVKEGAKTKLSEDENNIIY